MKNAIFTNFTLEDFTGYWDGRSQTIKAGQSIEVPRFLAEHFAKHLVNRELIRKNKDGSSVYPNGEKMTSPRKKEEVPLFMELFSKAVTILETENKEDQGDNSIENSPDIFIKEVEQKKKDQPKKSKATGDNSEEFEEKPFEEKSKE